MEIVNKTISKNENRCKSCNNGAKIIISILNEQNQILKIPYCTDYCSINDILIYDLLMEDFLPKIFYINI